MALWGVRAPLSALRTCALRTNTASQCLLSPRACLSSPRVSSHTRWPHGKQCFSTSRVRSGVGRFVSAKLHAANARYEGFLQRRFPRFYQLHHTFVEGFKLLFRDANEVRRIKSKLQSERLQYKDLPYREMEKLRQFRRDLIKAIPLVLISIPPFANYLVFVLMYFFPRQILIPHFWTPQQQLAFRGVYHSLRAQSFPSVLRGVERANRRVQDGAAQKRLADLCAKVQSGSGPKVAEVLGVRGPFSGPPLGIKRMKAEQKRQLSRLLFLSPHLPVFIVGRRLNSHALELLHLDRALSRLGPHQLSDSELRQACYVRGLDSDSVSVSQCREWLSVWLQVSSSLKESEVSLLLHNIVFLSAHYTHESRLH